MKNAVLTVLFILTAVPLFGQIQMNDLERLKEANFKYKFSQEFEVEGSPFYYEEWKPGHAIFENGRASNLYPLKYDIFHNRLLLQRNGVAYLVKPNTVAGFAFVENGQRTVFKNGFSSGKYDIYPANYLKMLYDGEVKLAVKYVSDKSENMDVFTGERTVYFDTEKTFYLINANGTFYEVDLEEDDILEALGKYQNELRKYAEKHDLSFEDEEDLKMLLEHYDALASGGSQLN